MEWILLVVAWLYGIVFGSFLNVCIYRIPAGESLWKKNSHCMSCGYELRWFDLIPLFSWLCYRGRCRKCKAKISVQYPLIEAANGFLFVLMALRFGCSVETFLYCGLVSALLALSVIDARTCIIPFGFNVFIFLLGVINLGYRLVCVEKPEIWLYVIGFFAVSVPLWLLYVLSGGRAIGGGDIKLMAAAGLLIGWKLIFLALILGCLLGSVIHIIRMKVSKAERVLAMGPYLSAGILLAVLFGEQFLGWYLGIFALH